jgi:hypothetical protein
MAPRRRTRNYRITIVNLGNVTIFTTVLQAKNSEELFDKMKEHPDILAYPERLCTLTVHFEGYND